jgi:hypothetical protein
MSKLFHLLYVLILAAWFGAIVMIAIAIPTLFRTLPDRALAGDAAATIFQSFDKTQMVFLPVLWIAAIGSLAFRNPTRSRRAFLMVALCGLTFTVGLMLFRVAPRMHALHTEFRNAPTPEMADGPQAEFQRLHIVAENLAKLNLFLTLALLIECTWTQNPRKLSIAVGSPTAPEPVT